MAIPLRPGHRLALTTRADAKRNGRAALPSFLGLVHLPSFCQSVIRSAACPTLISGVQSTDFSRVLLRDKDPTKVGTLYAVKSGPYHSLRSHGQAIDARAINFKANSRFVQRQNRPARTYRHRRFDFVLFPITRAGGGRAPPRESPARPPTDVVCA